jgi:hypothetical protein
MNLPLIIVILLIAGISALALLVLWAICKAGGDADDRSARVVAEMRRAKREGHS